MRARLTRVAVMAVMAVGGLARLAGAQTPDTSQLAIPGGPFAVGALPQGFAASAGGDVQVVVRLSDPSLAQAHGANAKQNGGNLSAAQQLAYVAQLGQKQDALAAQIRSLGGRELGR